MIPILIEDCPNQGVIDREWVKGSKGRRRKEHLEADEEGAVCSRAEDNSGFLSPVAEDLLATETGGPKTTSPISSKIIQKKDGQMPDPVCKSIPSNVVWPNVENPSLQLQRGEDAKRTRVHGWKRKARGKREVVIPIQFGSGEKKRGVADSGNQEEEVDEQRKSKKFKPSNDSPGMSFNLDTAGAAPQPRRIL
ncbi:hypothetical protein U1Q18_038658 [Sarracenia purpurea var. burkii]